MDVSDRKVRFGFCGIFLIYDFFFVFLDYIRIVTREKNPSPETVAVIDAKIAELNIDRSKLVES